MVILQCPNPAYPRRDAQMGKRDTEKRGEDGEVDVDDDNDDRMDVLVVVVVLTMELRVLYLRHVVGGTGRPGHGLSQREGMYVCMRRCQSGPAPSYREQLGTLVEGSRASTEGRQVRTESVEVLDVFGRWTVVLFRRSGRYGEVYMCERTRYKR